MGLQWFGGFANNRISLCASKSRSTVVNSAFVAWSTIANHCQLPPLLSSQSLEVLVQVFEDFFDDDFFLDTAVPAGDDLFGACAEV